MVGGGGEKNRVPTFSGYSSVGGGTTPFAALLFKQERSQAPAANAAGACVILAARLLVSTPGYS